MIEYLDFIGFTLRNYLRFDIHGLMAITSGILTLFLGTLVFFKDSHSSINRSFFQFTLNTAFWTIGFGMGSLVQNSNDAYFWTKFAHSFGVPFISVSNYLFCVRYIGERENRKLTLAGYTWATCTVILVLIFVREITTLRDLPWGRYSYWRLNFISAFHFLTLIVGFYFYSTLGFLSLTKYLKNPQNTQKRRNARNILIAFLIAYTGSVDFVASLGFNLYPFGYISLTIFTLTVSYNIIKHKLLDIRVVLKRTSLLLIIYTALLALSFPLTISLLQRLLNSPDSNPIHIVLGLGILTGIIFSLGPFIYAALIRKSYWLRGHTTTGLVHELKTPLSTIESAISVLSEDIKGHKINSQKSFQYLNIAEDNANRLRGFIDDLLTIAKIEEDAFTLDKTPTDINSLINETALRLKPLADKKGLTITCNLATPPSVEIDRPKIEQVLSNILSNALKFTDRGVITITSTHEKNFLKVLISDQGRGIHSKNLKKIFNRFYQSESSGKGSGIGLTIAKAWIEAHNGKIWAKSNGVGQGTTIHFTIPLN